MLNMQQIDDGDLDLALASSSDQNDINNQDDEEMRIKRHKSMQENMKNY